MTHHGFTQIALDQQVVPGARFCFCTKPALIASWFVRWQVKTEPRMIAARISPMKLTSSTVVVLQSISSFMCFGLSFLVYVYLQIKGRA
jgi:hypothetical protein